MANPFTIRATEFVRSNEAFLTLIAPDPVSFFLEPHARDDGLYCRLISIQGQPGSGKTTIARLFEFSTLSTLLRGVENETYSELISPLQKCGAIRAGLVRILACRLPLESDYRELWQLPYGENTRAELLQRLIQARAVLAWFSQLRKSGITPAAISLEFPDHSDAPLAFIGGPQGDKVLERARAVEAAIYRIVGALLPPQESEIEREIIEPYRPFDVIRQLRIEAGAAQDAASEEVLLPIVILDDAHFLHAGQLTRLKSWLIRRELTIGRWILSRLDVLQPAELFDSLSIEEPDVNLPGTTAGRDIIRINLQSTKRTDSRRNFRAMSRQMSRKYLAQMPIFGQNGITTLEEILPSRVDLIAPSRCEKLEQAVRRAARRLHVSPVRLAELEKMSADYLTGRHENHEDVRWAMVRILVHRYAKRTPQAALFPDQEGPEPSKPLRADLTVYDGARIQLMHDHDRPFYVGFDSLSDAASENAEIFLRLASHVVETAENLLIKQKPSAMQAREQHKLLIERAKLIVDAWNFPEHRRVRALAGWIASACRLRTMEPNAPLGAGANAYGIPQEEFSRIGSEHFVAANVLKFAVAYNAVTLVPNYECKGKLWCLVELGGVFIVQEGLPFKRGGFIEGSAEELDRQLKATS